MSTTYLKNDKEIVFLNSNNIAQETADIDHIDYNAIPSLSLFNRLSDEVALSATNVSNDIGALKTEDTWLSSQISSRVFIAYKTGDVDGSGKAIYGTANKLSVIELNNDEYNTLATATPSRLDPTALYVIKDNFIDAKGQVLSNLATPTADNHAANKFYVDGVSADILEMANTYANSLSTSLSTTIPVELAAEIEALSTSLSGTVDSKRLKAIEDLSTSLSTTVKNSNYAVINSDLKFSYDANNYSLKIAIPNINNEITVLSVDALDFVKNRLIQKLEIVDNKLRIYWRDASLNESDSYVEIEMNKLTQVYQGSDGIKILRKQDSDEIEGNEPFVISADYAVITNKDEFDLLSGTVRKLSTETIPGITSTVNTLSSTIIPTITSNVDTLSTELTAYTDSSKFAGKFAGLSSNVDTLSIELTTKFLLSSEVVDAIRNTLTAQISENNANITQNAENIEKLQFYATSLSVADYGTIAVLSSKADDAVAKANNTKLSAEFLMGPDSPIAAIKTAQDSYSSRIMALETAAETFATSQQVQDTSIDRHTSQINLLSGDAKSWDTSLSNSIMEDVSLSSTRLSTEINTLSAKLSGEVQDLSTSLSNEVDAKFENINIEELDKKVYFNGLSCTSLSISAYVSQSVFKQMVLNNELKPDTLYMVSSDMTDMYNERIVNLANPIYEQDAVNYRTLSTMVDSISSDLKSTIVDSLAGLDSESTLAEVIGILQTLSANLLN